jgi:arabinose-5-phosphate isomerase
VQADAPLAEAVRVMTQTPGRPGATSVVDATGVLVGVFTDGDLRRLLEEGRFSLTIAVGEVMCRAPRTVSPTTLVQDATRILREKTIDQLPVVDDAGRPVGLLDVQDVLALA